MAFDFSKLSKQTNQVGYIDIIKYEVNRGDALYCYNDENNNPYFSLERKEPEAWYSVIGYCAITAKESPDTSPRFISCYPISDKMKNVKFQYGGAKLQLHQIDNIDGKKNTKELLSLPVNNNIKVYSNDLTHFTEIYPAKVCNEYYKFNNDNTKGLWYLPSQYEVDILLSHKKELEDKAELIIEDNIWNSTIYAPTHPTNIPEEEVPNGHFYTYIFSRPTTGYHAGDEFESIELIHSETLLPIYAFISLKDILKFDFQ